jgi:peptide chain release factor 3
MILLNQTYGFASGALAAPQANAMAAVIDPLMNGVGAPWALYAIGAVIAVVLTYFKIPAIAEDARGTYLFNSKDLCMIEHIPELMNSGISSFKIEGRIRGAFYAATVTKAYRDAFDRDAYLRAELAPVFFGSAVNNFGVKELLECFIRIAPSPRPAPTETRIVEPAEEKMTGFVFKIHANMDPNHRDRIAFLKICSGTFERNKNFLHVRSGKQMKFSSPTAFMAEKKSIIDFAYPGDIVGLHDTGNFKIGDTFTEGEKLKFTGIPSFAPEQFRYIENADPLKFKQLAKGIDQLMDEGVAQLFTSSLNGRKIIGTVGALQFEVIEYRLAHEYNAACRWEPISIYKACWIESDNAEQLADFKRRKHTNMAIDKHGRDVFLADTSYALALAQENFKDIRFYFTSEF